MTTLGPETLGLGHKGLRIRIFPAGSRVSGLGGNIGASIVTYTILGVPYYSYCIVGPKTLF